MRALGLACVFFAACGPANPPPVECPVGGVAPPAFPFPSAGDRVDALGARGARIEGVRALPLACVSGTSAETIAISWPPACDNDTVELDFVVNGVDEGEWWALQAGTDGSRTNPGGGRAFAEPVPQRPDGTYDVAWVETNQTSAACLAAGGFAVTDGGIALVP